MLTSLLVLWACVAASSACSCYHRPESIDMFCAYDVIVQGAPLNRTQEGETAIYIFEVQHPLIMPEKLKTADTILVYTPSNGAACGAGLRIGYPMLLFGRGNVQDGKVWTNLCTPNSPLRVLTEMEAASLSYCKQQDAVG